MAKETTNQASTIIKNDEPYKPFTAVHVMDKTFRYVIESHGERNPTTGKLLAPELQDPKKGARYSDIEKDVEALVNASSQRGGIAVYDLPAGGNTALNNINQDINMTHLMWSEDNSYYIAVTPLINPGKSVLQAEKQALEYANLRKIEGYEVIFAFIFFTEHEHYGEVRKQFEDSKILQALKNVGTVEVIEARSEFNVELPSIISGANGGKVWKVAELVKSGILQKFSRWILTFFLEDIIAGFKRILEGKLPKSADDRSILIVFTSEEGGVRKSTIAGILIEYLRS